MFSGKIGFPKKTKNKAHSLELPFLPQIPLFNGKEREWATGKEMNTESNAYFAHILGRQMSGDVIAVIQPKEPVWHND